MGKHDDIELVKTELQIEEELDAHKRGWAVQAVGIVLLYLFILAAAAGVFGDGIASKVKESASGVTVESERFYRFESRMELKVKIAEAPGDVEIAFPNDYLNKMRVDSILPEPEQTEQEEGRTVYTFSGNGPREITFFLIPQSFASIDGTVNIGEHDFSLNHFIYP